MYKCKNCKTVTDLINEIIELKPEYADMRNKLYQHYTKAKLKKLLSKIKGAKNGSKSSRKTRV